MATKQITTRQQYWLGHVSAAEDSAGTIADYAGHHNLRLKTLYQWKSKLLKLGLYKHGAQQRNFLPVRAQPIEPASKPGCMIYLTNGVRVEFPGSLDSRAIRSIITSAGLKQ